MNISFLIAIVFKNHEHVKYEISVFESEKKIFNLINSLDHFFSAVRRGNVLEKSEHKRTNQIAELVEPYVKNFSIFIKNGEVIYSSKNKLILPEKYISHGIRSVLNKKSRGEKYLGFAGDKKNKMFFYIPLYEYNLLDSVLLVFCDISKLHSHQNDLYSNGVLIVFVISMSHLFFAFLLFRVTIRPIKILSSKSRDIANGRFSARVNSKRTDELGDLSNLFDVMAQSIEDKVGQLKLQMETITEAKNKIESMATIDELTGLYNRRTFFVRMEEEIDRSKRNNYNLGFIMIDVDHFKKFNDTHGHQIGDLVLKTVCQTIKGSCRSIDLVGRYGGEEIVVLAPDCSLDNGLNFAERIRKNVESLKINTPDGILCVTISLGVTSFDEVLIEFTPDVSKLLIYFSDTALYRAKEAGRNRVMAG